MKKIKILTILFILISITGPSHSENSGSKMQKIADELYDVAMLGGDHMGYADEILNFLRSTYGIIPAKVKSNSKIYSYIYNDYRSRDGRDIDPYSLLSGGLAIRESLQLETIRPRSSALKEVKLSTLKGPDIKSHPFKEMLKNRKYKIFPIAKYCPEDFYYIHFNNMSASLDFFDYLGQVGGSLYKRFARNSVDYRLKEKVLTQLALKENKEARKFYNLVIDEMAIVGSDPFIIEGSDITILYKIKTGPVFNITISGYRNHFKDKYKAKTAMVEIMGLKAERLYTQDRKINSFMLELKDGTVVISNSRKAVEHIIETSLGKSGSIYDADDFKYMRSIYPADESAEDAFIYLSDPFIRRLVGPELRIKEARRMQESMRIALLEKYLILYYHINKKFTGDMDGIYRIINKIPYTLKEEKKIQEIKNHRAYKYALAIEMDKATDKDGDISYYKYTALLTEKIRKDNPKLEYPYKYTSEFIELLKKKYVELKGFPHNDFRELLSLVHPSVAIRKDKRFEGLYIAGNLSAASKTHGRYGYMTPNIETALEWISNAEAEDYKKFLNDYNQFWRDYFDPIGIRIKMKKGIKIDTCILPLINNSIYNMLAGIIGGSPVELHTGQTVPGDIFSLALKINKERLMSREMGSLMDSLYDMDPEMKGVPILEMFKDEIQFHIHDALPLVDFDGKFILREIMRDRPGISSLSIGFLAWSLFHPVRISIPINASADIGKFLNALDNYLAKKRYTGRSWDTRISNYFYTYKTAKIRVVKLTIFDTVSFRIYYTVLNNTLHAASTKQYIEKIVSIFSDKNKAPGPDPRKCNIAAIYRPAQMKEERPLYEVNIMESTQDTSFKNFGTIKLADCLFPGEKEPAGKIFSLFGFMPVCPMGGKYSISGKEKSVYNSVFGKINRPEINKEKIRKESLQRFFSTEEIRIQLEFTREGIKTLIRTE